MAASELLESIINNEISLHFFFNWFLGTEREEPYSRQIHDFRCSRTDFLEYFMNFLHKEIPGFSTHGESSQKPTGCKKIEPFLANHTTAKDKSTVISNGHKSPRIKNKLSTVNTPCAAYTSNAASTSNTSSTSKFRNVQSEEMQTSFSTPKNAKKSFTTKSSEKVSPLCLGDFIVSGKSSGKKKTKTATLSNEARDESSKRIKPTCLNQVYSNNSLRSSGSSFNNFENTEEVSIASVNDSRSFLAEERLKILSQRDSAKNMSVPASKTISTIKNVKREFEPDINLVTNEKELNCIIEIYVKILRHDMVSNIASEIYFLISLLLLKHFREGNGNENGNSSERISTGVELRITPKLRCSDLFDSIHNVVYFASKCLEEQVYILQYYDKTTLNLLYQNKRLQMFSHPFTERIKNISEKKSEHILDISCPNEQTNICFDLDTDNRQNFPSERAFNTFRKQRDLFYEILRIWNEHHLKPEFNFNTFLGGKIKSLFSFHNESATFVHFCRLFKAQLLSTCGRYQKEEGLSDTSFLNSIPEIDGEKLMKLTSRLVTKPSTSGINRAPSFTGHQEFYKDFIVFATNYSFNRHLCDILVADILELNDTKFLSMDFEENEGCINPSTKKAYIECVTSLRILAKFLGFIEALPYHSVSSDLSEMVLTFKINPRKEATPLIDIKKLVENSIQQSSVILTIPWVTTYLSMLDYSTLRLAYFRSVHEILFDLHRNCSKLLSKELHMGNYKTCLIKYTLGWLFQLPLYPTFVISTEGTESAMFGQRPPTVMGEPKLDDLDIIDQNILYMCCPYLEEIKKLLLDNGSGYSITVKHITPVTAVPPSNEGTKRKLQQKQLEEAFFKGHPSSMKQTVEFVGERISSVCTKDLHYTTFPKFKKEALRTLKFMHTAWSKDHNIDFLSMETSIPATFRDQLNNLTLTCVQGLKERCRTDVCHIMDNRIPPCVANLLPIDALEQTKEICVAVSRRKCSERTDQWINMHVTDTLFTKDFNTETMKFLTEPVKEKPLFTLPMFGAKKVHNENAMSGFTLLENLRELAIYIAENSHDVNEDMIQSVLNQAYLTFTERKDVNDCIIKSGCALLVDIWLLFITHNPNVILNETLLKNVVHVCSCYNGRSGEFFNNILCPRNVIMMSKSFTNEFAVWETLASCLVFLLKEGILTTEEFETQCSEFLHQGWDKEMLNKYTWFLRRFVNCYRDRVGSLDKFVHLLEFLSNFCIDLGGD